MELAEALGALMNQIMVRRAPICVGAPFLNRTAFAPLELLAENKTFPIRPHQTVIAHVMDPLLRGWCVWLCLLASSAPILGSLIVPTATLGRPGQMRRQCRLLARDAHVSVQNAIGRGRLGEHEKALLLQLLEPEC